MTGHPLGVRTEIIIGMNAREEHVTEDRMKREDAMKSIEAEQPHAWTDRNVKYVGLNMDICWLTDM